ncbi:hypothetical protein ACF05L_22540 [Streptomyces bobili]|uniref:hypothetical protein n=1 Tax=Streptomyces bobili TaxID=67280 RepID=UPI0036F830BD
MAHAEAGRGHQPHDDVDLFLVGGVGQFLVGKFQTVSVGLLDVLDEPAEALEQHL